jgi:iron complex outermembrane receptor protein
MLKSERARLFVRAFATSALVALAATEGHAQTTEPGAVDELIVTATRRNTTVQETPLAITALGETVLQNTGATGLQDVTSLVPSLKIGGGSDGGGRITLRGIQASGEATVGLYYDETPLTGPSDTSQNPGGSSQDGNLFDIERIEVLRGPQGTLYGSSSMGGTVRIIFNKADTNNYSGRAEVQATAQKDGDPGFYAKGAVNIPIIQDKLGARLILYKENRGGFIDQTRYNQENINERRQEGARLMLTAKPTEKITWYGMAMFQNTESPGGGSTYYPLLGGKGDHFSDRLVIPRSTEQFALYSSDFGYDLGFADFNWSSSFYRWDQLNASDYSQTMISNKTSVANCTNYFKLALGVPVTTCNATQMAQFGAFADTLIPTTLYKPAYVKTWVNEFRLSSTGEGPLKWTVGAFQETRDDHVDSTLGVVKTPTGRIPDPPPFFFHRDVNTDTKNQALFADVSYDILPGLTLNYGVRSFKYDKTTSGQTDVPNYVSGSLIEPYREIGADAKGTLQKFSVNYQFADDYLVYATAAEGFRPGGANNTPNLDPALVAYGPDAVKNYELGLKTAWFDKRLTVNLAAYQIDWEDIQTSATTLSGCCSFILNAGQARIRGMEIEATARPIRGLVVTTGLTFTDPKLMEDQINPNIRDSTSLGDAGDQIPQVGKFQGTLNAEYSWPLGDTTNGLVRFDYNYTGRSYTTFRPTNVYYEQQGAFGVVNGRVGIEGNGWGAYAFVRNAFDIFGAITVSSSAGSEQLTNAVQPRMFGLNFRRDF